MNITFFGAAQTVTGSKHVVESNGFKLLLDCGMHQGRRLEAYELNKTIPFVASAIKAVILSHAHADHCGTLPLFVKNGYEHKIYCTEPTADIARLIMIDSAKLQQHDFEHLQENAVVETKPLPPLYSLEDVDKACEHFETYDYERTKPGWHQLNEKCRFKFYDAGHILGSEISVIQCDEDGVQKNLLFTGDLGNADVPILHDPEMVVENIETIITECTYGDRLHRPVAEVDNLLIDIINDAVTNKRKIIVPAFALGRTQELIYILHRLHNEGKISALPIYIDSPLSNSITEVFSKHSEDFDSQAWKDFISHKESPFAFENLKYVESKEDSKALNTAEGPFMVIASSGMCEGGRILHHLEHNIWKPEAIIMLTGYQAEHTLGRKIQDGAANVKIYDRMHELKAKVVTVNEFSAHADQKGLLSYISKLKGLKNVFLVHSEPSASEVFKTLLHEQLPELNIFVPKPGENFKV